MKDIFLLETQLYKETNVTSLCVDCVVPFGDDDDDDDDVDERRTKRVQNVFHSSIPASA